MHTPSTTSQSLISYYSQQYNARASIPDHSDIFTRWQRDSALARRTNAGLLDVSYGPAAGERLDFFPAHKSSAPLLVFIHGGWWRSLDKSDFSFLVPGYLQEGFNVALTNYTLAPHATLEEITQQQCRALALTCPDIFGPVVFRDNGSSHLRSSDEASEVYGRADRSNIARGG